MPPTQSPITFDRVLVVLALGCSLLALLLPPRVTPTSAPQFSPEQLAAIQKGGEEENAAQQSSAPPATASAPAEAVSPDGVTIRQVHEWVWGLEQRLVQLEQKMEQAPPVANAAPPPPDVAQARKVATDRQATPQDRLAALSALRSANARTPDVVQAMLRLQAESKDPAVRADVFRQLSGVKDPALKAPLIDAVLKDEHPKVREEAAETMARFRDDPFVRAALTRVAQSDPDSKVKKQAREALEED